MRTAWSIRAPLEADDRDVVGLRPADGVLADGGQDGLAGRGGSLRGRGQDFLQALDAKRLAVSVHRLGDAVGVEDDQVARLEGNGDRPVNGGADDAQRRAGPRAADGLDRARCAAHQGVHVPGVDHRHLVRPRVDFGHGHGHEPAADSSVAKMAVDLGHHLARPDAAADQVPHFRADAGDHERGRHALAGDVADRHGPPRRCIRRLRPRPRP